MLRSLKKYSPFDLPNIKSLSAVILLFFGSIAFFGDFIANERPIYAQISGQSYFPVLHQYGEYLGMKPYSFVNEKSWDELEYQKCLMPFIPFSSYNISVNEQSLLKPSRRHYLGTDAVGRDVAAGLVKGTRLAILIGLIASFGTIFLGLIIGLLAAYYGDDKLKISRFVLLAILILNGIIIFYGNFSVGFSTLRWMILMFFNFGLFRILSKLELKIAREPRVCNIPLDMMISRCIEIFKAIPNLLILLTVIAVFKVSSISGIAILLALLSWPNVARLVRAEVLNIREKEYIHAAKMLGLSDFKIMWSQLLPNILSPILVAFVFGISGAIMAEATLSFLGIGIGIEEVTWGSLLSAARNNIHAWWLAVFPGLCLFLLIISLNNVAEKYLINQRH